MVSWHFLQYPRVAIGVAEVNIFNAPWVFVNLAHFNASTCKRFASLVYVLYDQMQSLDRSRLHFRNVGHTSPNDDVSPAPERSLLTSGLCKEFVSVMCHAVLQVILKYQSHCVDPVISLTEKRNQRRPPLRAV